MDNNLINELLLIIEDSLNNICYYYGYNSTNKKEICQKILYNIPTDNLEDIINGKGDELIEDMIISELGIKTNKNPSNSSSPIISKDISVEYPKYIEESVKQYIYDKLSQYKGDSTFNTNEIKKYSEIFTNIIYKDITIREDILKGLYDNEFEMFLIWLENNYIRFKTELFQYTCMISPNTNAYNWNFDIERMIILNKYYSDMKQVPFDWHQIIDDIYKEPKKTLREKINDKENREYFINKFNSLKLSEKEIKFLGAITLGALTDMILPISLGGYMLYQGYKKNNEPKRQ